MQKKALEKTVAAAAEQIETIVRGSNPAHPKVEQWLFFSEAMLDHIRNYAIEQYEDTPADTQWMELDPGTLKQFLIKYSNRIGRNARGIEDAKKDCLKIAHYAQRLFLELNKQENIPNPEQIELMKHALGDTGYRNHFVTNGTGTDTELWDQLVQKGFAVKRKNHFDEMNNSVIYHVTEKGQEYIGVFYNREKP